VDSISPLVGFACFKGNRSSTDGTDNASLSRGRLGRAGHKMVLLADYELNRRIQTHSSVQVGNQIGLEGTTPALTAAYVEKGTPRGRALQRPEMPKNSCVQNIRPGRAEGSDSVSRVWRGEHLHGFH
jgi:hypothetical protein